MGEITGWAAEHSFEFIQALGILGALGFNAYTLLRSARVNEALFVRKMFQDHRAIWSVVLERPELARVLQPKVDLARDPVTESESILVNLVILHLSGILNAVDKGIMGRPGGLETDVRTFFSLPIPNHVWRTMRRYRSPRMIAFVEAVLENGTR